MNLRLLRHPQGTATPGELDIDGVAECFTLEDQDRDLEHGGSKVPGATAIPCGTYKVAIDFSTRFQRPLLHVLDVPQFTGVRIHAGNTTADTEGCILVGQDWNGTALLRSRDALFALQPKVAAALERGEEVTIEVEREPS